LLTNVSHPDEVLLAEGPLADKVGRHFLLRIFTGKSAGK
jgi:hypothetical protein